MSWILISFSAAVLLVLGFWAVKKLDAFLTHQDDKSGVLRIGMEYPGMEKTVAEEMELLVDTYPGCELFLIGGNREELCRMLRSGAIDVAVLESASDKEPFICVAKPMKIFSVTSEMTGLPIVRRLSGTETAFVLMRSVDSTDICGEFYRLLTGKNS